MQLCELLNNSACRSAVLIYGVGNQHSIRLAGTEVHVSGHNLDTEPRPTVQLFIRIVRHRIPWIVESNAAISMAADWKQR